MPVPFSDQPARQETTRRHAAQAPPHRADDALRQAHAVQEAAQHRADRPRRARDALPQAVDGPEHRRVWRAVVDEDRLRGERERPADDLDEQHAREGEPDGETALGTGRRAVGGARDERQVRREEVGEREAQ